MRTIEPVSRYKRDYKRELRGPFRLTLDHVLDPVLLLLANDIPLPAAMRDHQLTGTLNDCRDCHVKPDLVLIYRKPDAEHSSFFASVVHSELDL